LSETLNVAWVAIVTLMVVVTVGALLDFVRLNVLDLYVLGIDALRVAFELLDFVDIKTSWRWY
jgi:hypothetical protein